MKHIINSLLALLLAAILALSFTACGTNPKTPEQPVGNKTAQTQASTENGIPKTGLWKNAVYLADTELGEGATKIIVEVKAEEQSIKCTVYTNETKVGAALLAAGLIDGDISEYGLYVKVVNGITADYSIDQSYWAFYINGEYATTGVDSTNITDGAEYQLVYTK